MGGGDPHQHFWANFKFYSHYFECFFAVVFYAIQWGGLYLIFNSNSLKDLKDGIIAILLFEKEPVFPFYCMMRS